MKFCNPTLFTLQSLVSFTIFILYIVPNKEHVSKYTKGLIIWKTFSAYQELKGWTWYFIYSCINKKKTYIYTYNGQLRRCRNMRASGKFPPFPTARTQHQHWTLQRRRTGHFKHHTERHRKLQKRNMPHLQSQRTTYHHRSQQTDHQFLRRHFQPKQEQLPALRDGGIGIFGFAVLAIFRWVFRFLCVFRFWFIAVCGFSVF